MKQQRHKKSFLPAGCGGAFAGFMLWVALKRILDDSMTWWMGLVLILVCIAVGLAFQTMDERKIKRDVITRKKQNEG